MTKRLVATRSDDSQKWMEDLTHPILKEYANRCGADFLVIRDMYKDFHIHYRILKFYELFDEYDEIYSIDTDTIIKKNCPNIFEVVPVNYYIASVFEDVGSRKNDRRSRIRAVQKKFGDVGYDRDYINTGSALFRKESKEIFNAKDSNSVWNGLGFDDVELWYKIHKLGFKVYELPIVYNYMSLFQESWSGFKSRGEAFVIHYAGQAQFCPSRSREEIIKEDILVLRKYGMV